MLVERDRQLGTGLTETITVHNYARDPFQCRIELLADADFADLFEVKECRQPRRKSRARHPAGDQLILMSERKDDERSIAIELPGSRVEEQRLVVVAPVAAHSAWSVTVSAVPRTRSVGR
nr:glycogen debranching N-terminal domain-containing protein [Arthrobacter sp. 24S4-2]